MFSHGKLIIVLKMLAIATSLFTGFDTLQKRPSALETKEKNSLQISGPSLTLASLLHLSFFPWHHPTPGAPHRWPGPVPSLPELCLALCCTSIGHGLCHLLTVFVYMYYFSPRRGEALLPVFAFSAQCIMSGTSPVTVDVVG